MTKLSEGIFGQLKEKSRNSHGIGVYWERLKVVKTNFRDMSCTSLHARLRLSRGSSAGGRRPAHGSAAGALTYL